MDRRRRLLLVGSLVCVPLLIAATAAAAPTELASGVHADSEMRSDPALYAAIRLSGRNVQPELFVALSEPQNSLYPAPGQAAAILPDRQSLKKSTGGLVMKAFRTIVSTTAASRPTVRCALHPRFGHTATADPYVDAHK